MTRTKTRALANWPNNAVSVLDYGAKGDGVTDDTAAIQEAIDNLDEQTLFMPAGLYVISSTIDFTSVSLDGEHAKITGNFDAITVILGGNPQSSNNPIQKLSTVSNTGTAKCIVRVQGAKNQIIYLKKCSYLQIFGDTNVSTAYSSFYCNYIQKLELTTSPGDGIKWINENQFFINRIKELYIGGGYSHNHNIFHSLNLENATIEIAKGSSNIFRDTRGEGGCDVTLGDDAIGNIFEQSYQSSGYDFKTLFNIVSDLGKGNYFYNTASPSVPQTIADIKARSVVKYVDNTLNYAELSNVTPSDVIDVQANNILYLSDYIPVEGANLVVSILLDGVTTGGVRPTIFGYKSDKTEVASSGSDFSITAGSNAAFGDSPITNNTWTDGIITILNPAARYIRIQLRCGSNALSFDSLSITAQRFGKVSARGSANLVAPAAARVPFNGSFNLKEVDPGVTTDVFELKLPIRNGAGKVNFIEFEFNYTLHQVKAQSTYVGGCTSGTFKVSFMRIYSGSGDSTAYSSITDSTQIDTGSAASSVTWTAVQSGAATDSNITYTIKLQTTTALSGSVKHWLSGVPVINSNNFNNNNVELLIS